MGKRKIGLQTALGQAQERQQQEAKRQKREKEQERLSESKKRSSSSSSNKAGAGPSRPWVPFTKHQHILLVGEGNFSFAASLVRHIVPEIGARLYATAFDSEEVASQKYPDLGEHLSVLKDAGAHVLFGVDATALHKCKTLKSLRHHFDRIVFLYPHVGLGEKDEERNVRLNQGLLLGFFKSSADLLATGALPLSNKSAKRKSDEDEDADLEDDAFDMAPDPDAPSERGSVLVVLREGKPYSLWAVGALAKQGPMIASSLKLPTIKPADQPVYLQIRSGLFETDWYPGYAHRRTLGFDQRHSTKANEDTQFSAKDRRKAAEDRGSKVKSRMWQFCLKDAS